jgi:two-component system, chemotaxis family, chemotaxis protein CheY
MAARILSVDDSDFVRRIVKATLEKAGYAVSEAADGLLGLAALAREVPDLVLCDVNMPNMDGLTFARRVRETHPRNALPIIMLTTEGAEDFQEEGRQAGVDAWLRKPFDPAALRSLVEQLLAARAG